MIRGQPSAISRMMRHAANGAARNQHDRCRECKGYLDFPSIGEYGRVMETCRTPGCRMRDVLLPLGSNTSKREEVDLPETPSGRQRPGRPRLVS